MKLSKVKKRIVMTLGILLILILCTYAIFEWVVVRYEENEKIQYTYKSKGNIDYKVYLKPNIMYDEEYLGENRFYVFKYIDHVDMDLKYDYTSSASADLKTDYSATAYLQGLHGDDNEVLWSKEYVLAPDKMEKKSDSRITIELNLPVAMSHFSDIKDALYLDSEINDPVVLKVVFRIHTVASTKDGSLEDTMSPNLIIPIGNSVFKIEGESEAAGENKIVEKTKSRIPVNKENLFLLFGVSFILLILVILVGLTKEAVSPDSFEKSISNIFKEYSERLAGMEHTISYQFSDAISVNSIEDMIKIADEVGQPVFYYKVDSNVERKIEFFVFDNSRVYYMVIFGEIKPENENTPMAEKDSNNP